MLGNSSVTGESSTTTENPSIEYISSQEYLLNNDASPNHLSASTTKRAKLKKIFIIAYPLVLVNLMQLGYAYTSVYTLSAFGESELAVTNIIDSISVLISSINIAAEQPVRSMAGDNYGQLQTLLAESNPNNALEIEKIREQLGAVLQHGWIVAIMMSGLQTTIFLAIPSILMRVGIDQNLINLLDTIMLPYALSLPLQAIIKTNANYVSAIGKEKFLLFYNAISLGVGLLANHAFISGNFGFPALRVAGYGYGILAQACVGSLVFKLYFIFFDKDIKTYKLFVSKIRKYSHYLKRILKLGIPMVVFSIVSGVTGLVLSIFYGNLGQFQLAIEQTGMQYVSWSNAVATGFVRSTAISLSQTLHINNPQELREYFLLGLGINAMCYLPPALAMTAFPMELAHFYLDRDLTDFEPTIRIIFALAVISGLGSSVYSLASEGLSSLYDTLVPSIISLITTLSVILPLSYVAGFVLKSDVIGIDSVLCAGMAVQSGALLWRWHKKSLHYNYPEETVTKPEIPSQLFLATNATEEIEDGLLHSADPSAINS